MTASWFTCAIALALVAFVTAPTRAGTLLQIDYGWRTDGKNACDTPAFVEGAPWRRIACIDPIADIVDFARRMDTQFSSNPSCHGMELVRFPWGPISTDKAVEILKRPHWLFFIFAYAPGDAKQVWKREDPSKKSVFGGEGSPKQIVEDVCAVVNDRGGIISRTR